LKININNINNMNILFIFNKQRVFISLNKNIKRNFTPILGRWSVDKEKPQEDTIIDWANHDHCGSDSCKLERIKDHKLKDKELDSKRNAESKNEFTENYIENYLTAFII
jgi:hypothetical protein